MVQLVIDNTTKFEDTTIELRESLTSELTADRSRTLKLMNAIEHTPESNPVDPFDFGYSEAREFAKNRVDELPLKILVEQYDLLVTELCKECSRTGGGQRFLQMILNDPNEGVNRPVGRTRPELLQELQANVEEFSF